MPYPIDHKHKTHARIVDRASRLFRKKGYLATGVDVLMGAAGLTRGGFYAHFRNKAALLAEALEHAFDESEANMMSRGLEGLTGDAWLRAASERYLSTTHRSLPEEGCAVPSLGAEVARAPASVRRVFTKRAEAMRDRIAERISGDRREATRLLARWVGAVLIARAVDDRALADEILDACREAPERAAR
jgi:TetR/AcrR family transcriptional repressor of nem operon